MKREVTIQEIAEDISPGFACRPLEGKGVGLPQLRPYSITEEGKLDFSQYKYVPIDTNDLEKYKMRKGDVIFNNTNSPVLVGKTALFDHDYDCVYSNHMTRIRIKEDLADPGYVARYLHSLFLRGVFKNRCQQWVNQAAISKTDLGNLKIPLPPLDDQKNVNNLLLQVESTIAKRRQTLRLADEFLKSAFLDMFGEPKSNPKKWPMIQFAKLGKIKKDVVANDQIFSGCACVGLEHIESQTGELLGWDKFDESIRSNKFKFSKDQVLYGKLRPYLNKVSLPYIDGVCSTDILPISAINQVSNRYFIAYLMRTKYFVSLASSKSTGANLPRVNPSQIEKFMVYKPPFKRQQKFADLVQKVEKLKEKQKQSETQLQNLFNSLMQRAFRGELF